MEVHFTPELQKNLVHSAKQSRNAVELVQEVLARYLADESRFFEAVEGWADEDRRAAMSHIEEGSLQGECGELMNGAQAGREIPAWKNSWREDRLPNDMFDSET